MVRDYKEDIKECKKETEKGSPLSTWAKSNIPTLEHQLMMAEQVKKSTSNF
ncbi:MAG: hypothetical protein ABI813_12420 [Bacteroidota bacterium]